MFLPSEAVYAELHASFPNPGRRMRAGRGCGSSRRRLLMATLTTIRAVLKDVRMREQAHIIQKKVGELSGSDVEPVGRSGRHTAESTCGLVVEDVRQVAISQRQDRSEGGGHQGTSSLVQPTETSRRFPSNRLWRA